MRTTLTLEDDIAAKLRAESRRTGQPFKRIVNEYLRVGLAQRRSVRSAPVFKVEPRHLGAPLPGLSYDRISTLLDEIEGAERR